MKKLKLELDTLSVESFDTREIDALTPGTVHGHNTQLSECHCEPNSSPYYSQCCTADPFDLQCINSRHYCYETAYEVCTDTESGMTNCC